MFLVDPQLARVERSQGEGSRILNMGHAIHKASVFFTLSHALRSGVRTPNQKQDLMINKVVLCCMNMTEISPFLMSYLGGARPPTKLAQQFR